MKLNLPQTSLYNVGWLVGWLVGQLNDWTFQTTSKQQNPSTEAFLAVNKKTAWAISRSAMRAYSIYQLAGTRREKERTGHRIECFYLQKQKRIRQKKMFFWFLFLSQTYSLIDTATLRSTEAQGRAIEEGLLVDRGYWFVCVFFVELLISDTVDAASGQLNNVPNQHNTLARFSRMLHSPNSVCLSLFVYLPPVTTMTSIVRI
ncbi:hypothetical protein T4E_5115 [Trichinella pseudospiralis]|uniref:Uncharacterized protein n=1 Tax=Trichinella pseudospiralis TaxID=6337 RepID=A0A0V0Y037_TRIPS|nr:hypothetical protein T4E_5115 [Trichinella pseudospiralis]